MLPSFLSLLRRPWWQWGMALLAIVIGPYLWSRAISPWRRVSYHFDSASLSRAAPDATGPLRLATYNIAHGCGTADSNWNGGDSVERIRRLDDIAKLLRDADLDLVLLNEVDFDASWSGSVNQAEYLAKSAGFAYRVELRNIDFRVLFWTVRFGNAIFSKYPLERVEYLPLPEYATWETWLGGKKNAVTCDVRIRDQRVRILGTHLEARGEPVRVQSARVIAEAVRQSDMPVFVMGDLNSTPPGFPYSASDPKGDNAIAVLDASGLLLRHSDADEIAERDLTFPSIQPRSIIDWILVPPRTRILEYGPIDTRHSDHRPVLTVVATD